MRKLTLIGVAAILFLGSFCVARWRKLIIHERDFKHGHGVHQQTRRGRDVGDASRDPGRIDSLPALDAHCYNDVQEIGRPELVKPYMDEATSGDYDHLLQITMKYVDVE